MLEDKRFSKIGFHADAEGISDIIKYWGVHQFFFHSPVNFVFSMNTLQYNLLNTVMEENKDHVYIVHSPYWYTILRKKNKVYKHCLRNIFQHIELAQDLGVNYFVVHPGGLGKTEEDAVSRSEAMLQLCELSVYLNRFMTGSFKLVWENSGSSSSGAKGLKASEVLKCKQMLGSQAPNIGFCFDTQHAYCGGEALDSFDTYLKGADVIHLNANPPGILPGSFKDRHSNTPLYESEGMTTDFLISIVYAYAEVPKVIECYNETTIKNFKYLSETLK